MPDHYIFTGAFGAVFTVLWWLLRNKDAAQADQIKALFTKHDEDVKALQELRIYIAGFHYEKSEVDTKFNELRQTLKSGFEEIAKRFDKLSDVLGEHLRNDK